MFSESWPLGIKLKERKMNNKSEIQDKAFKNFTIFLKEVLEKSKKVHELPTSEFLLDDLMQTLFKNYRWENALTKEDIESFIKQSKN